ncbi:PH domain-containing protein [Amphibacillus cookii]|uniref:PH domain-containing protein n=1 Tax=Amphibacillus cookii TaxID=767787 RepID=UPI0019576D0D|nr:PH domain-containing protein [Amphibacillus cookii]MBM7540330.1 membrane protein YdbS with pleckstrin-like domain [Amphibacillus cookii]
MRYPPSQRIAPSAIKVWKIHGLIYSIILMLITIGLFITAAMLKWNYWFSGISLIFTIVIVLLSIILIPSLRWRRWRYQLYDQEIYIQHGIIIVKRTLVPMVRVQHVDTKQGPILKKFNLANLEITTAATTHEIPALSEAEAEQLRDQISILARVEQDDI